MIKRGRQISPTLSGIREDHRKRYELAIEVATARKARDIADVGCGAGYGSWMMADEGFHVRAYDVDASILSYGEAHYSHRNLRRVQADIALLDPPLVDMMTLFEVIEHSLHSVDFLSRARRKVGCLVGSVPNEEVIPFSQSRHREHVRHFTPREIVDMLRGAGWRIVKIGCQPGKRGADALVTFGRTDGRTLVFVAEAA